MTLHCVRGCTRRGSHTPTCPGDDCPGCEPRLAAVGLRVCDRCEESARKALRALPDLWEDVQAAGVLRAGSRGSGGDGRPLPIDPDAADWRGRVRARLVGWCLVLEEDFSASLDDCQDTVAWMADKVGIYAGRLLASAEHADQLVADLCGWTEDDAFHEGLYPEGRRLAFRSSSQRGVTVPCPSCGERVRLDPTVEYSRCKCGEWGTHEWWQDRLAPDLDKPMRMADLLAWLLLHHRVTVTAATVRQWAHRGKIVAKRDDDGATVYEPIQVARVAAEQRAKRVKIRCACGHSLLKHPATGACEHEVKREDERTGRWSTEPCGCLAYDTGGATQTEPDLRELAS